MGWTRGAALAGGQEFAAFAARGHDLGTAFVGLAHGGQGCAGAEGLFHSVILAQMCGRVKRCNF